MEHVVSESIPTGPIDKSRVLSVKPLRSLVPIFPGQPDSSNPLSSPFACIPPNGPFPSGAAPFYPFFMPNESQRMTGARNSSQTTFPSPVPLNSYRTPPAAVPASNGGVGSSRKNARGRASGGEDGFSFGMDATAAEDEDTGEIGAGKRKSRRKAARGGPQVAASTARAEVDVEVLAQEYLKSFDLINLDLYQGPEGEKDLAARALLVYNLLRRKITQLDEARDPTPGITRRPDLKCGTILMNKGVKGNANKKIGSVSGVEVGDIFFFRMEMCLMGLHSPTMAGIDYMSVKLTGEEEPIATSIVSSGGYDDDEDDGEVLIYSGQGGVARRDKQVMDQKLERGNLALEKSLHRANEVRVIRGLKDIAHANQTAKVYVYDGLYKIHESWVEKGKSGCNVFKYKLVRIPGQPEAFTLWKSIQQWKDGVTQRVGVILPDLTSGAENLAVCLVNDVDDEKGPAYFTYFPSLKYVKPFSSTKPSLSCRCTGGCQPGNFHCNCLQKNGGYLPYSALGVLMTHNSVVHECGPSCVCPPDCRNRVSQAGLKVRLEVFKTKEKGWGLRSWDPIRAGTFICEYAGEVIDASVLGTRATEDDNYIFDTTRRFEPLEAVDEAESVETPHPLVISAKNVGNVARFMNHSCSPNVYWQPILRENNEESFLHVGLYAIRHIPPLQELTFNYGLLRPDKPGTGKKKKCLCGSSKCRGYFF